MNKLIQEHKEAVNYTETPKGCCWCKFCKEVELDALLCSASEDGREWFEVQLYSSCDLFEFDPKMGSSFLEDKKGATMDEKRTIDSIKEELQGVLLEFKSKENPTQRDVDLIKHRMDTVLLSAQDAGRIVLGNIIKVKVKLEDGKIKIEYPKWIVERKFY
jgi:hypothetical protein